MLGMEDRTEGKSRVEKPEGLRKKGNGFLEAALLVTPWKQSSKGKGLIWRGEPASPAHPSHPTAVPGV